MHKKLFRLWLTPKVAERISYQKASLQDIMFTLFQDGVCAKARQVIISTTTIDDKTWLAIADDGEEIFANNASNLVDNKRTNKDIYFLKFARRLSICNLLHRGALVESKRLSITLAAEDFPINRDVQMQSGKVERGTKISFPITINEITELVRIIKCLAAYSPVSIIFNGSKFTQNNRVLAQV